MLRMGSPWPEMPCDAGVYGDWSAPLALGGAPGNGGYVLEIGGQRARAVCGHELAWGWLHIGPLGWLIWPILPLGG